MEKDYITITGTEYYFGNIVFDNDYDEEAIKVMIKTFGKVGYVANSSRTVAKRKISKIKAIIFIRNIKRL